MFQLMIANENTALENLPLPYVQYPSLYGTFIRFKKKADDTETFLCACHLPAFGNYLRSSLYDGSDAVFIENLCHVCLKKVPRFRYCHSQYVNGFNYYYGWYVLVRQWQHGFERYGVTKGSSYAIDDEKTQRQAIENEIRVEMGFPLLRSRSGKLNQRLLFLLVVERFSEFKVVNNAKIKDLQGLEIDIFIPALRLGFEYQGKQHYKAVKHWGGESGLTELKKRDRKKKRLCVKNGIKLITIHYRYEVNHQLLDSLLQK